MKKLFSLALLAAAASSPAYAADFGLGVSVQSDDSWLYVPIDITPSFRLEPSIRYRDGESTSVNVETMFGTPVTMTVNSESKGYELALGLFGMRQLGESVRVYFGGRIAYVDSDTKLHFRTEVGNVENEQTEETSDEGYRISPTLGFEYLFNEHFSIGAEAEWFYQDIDAELRASGESPVKADSEATGTDTRLIARFKF